jgi:DNA-binding transcriptional LysR family regulator
LIAASAVTPGVEWQFAGGGKKIGIKVNPRLTVTNNEAAIQAALQGFGITRLLSYQVAAHLASGQLQTVLQEYEPPPLPIHVLHREGRQASAKVRTFVDLLVDRLRADRALN